MTQSISIKIATQLMNGSMKLILTSPLHSLVSKSILLIRFTGRKSGKDYATPVSYARESHEILVFTHDKWWKNLVGGAPVSVRLQGRERRGLARPISDDPRAVFAGMQLYFRQVPQDAKFYKVRLEDSGQPNTEDVQRAAQTTIMIRIRLEEPYR